MPTPPAIPNLIRFRLWFDLGSGYTGGVGQYMSYSGTTPAPPADMDAYCNQVMGAFGTHLASFMNQLYKLDHVTARALDSGGGEGASTAAPVQGTDSNPELPVEACALAVQKVSRVYRGGKPRAYWPFGSTTSLADPHTWTSTFVTNLETALLAFSQAAFNTRPPGAVIPGGQQAISLYQNFQVTTNPKTGRAENTPQYRGTAHSQPVIPPDAIIAITVNKYVSSQRRRTRATGA